MGVESGNRAPSRGADFPLRFLCNPNSTHPGRTHDHVERTDRSEQRFEVESPIAESQLRSSAKLAALCRTRGCETQFDDPRNQICESL